MQKKNKFHFTADDGSENKEHVDKILSHSDTAKESDLSEEPIEPSDAMKQLLIALEFNSIDMYN